MMLDDSDVELQRHDFLRRFITMMDSYKTEFDNIPAVPGGLGMGLDEASISRGRKISDLNKKYCNLIHQEKEDDIKYAFSMAYLGVHEAEFEPGSLLDCVEHPENYCESGMSYVEYLLNEDTSLRIKDGATALGINL